MVERKKKEQDKIQRYNRSLPPSSINVPMPPVKPPKEPPKNNNQNKG